MRSFTLVLLLSACAALAAAQRPNVLVLIADDWSYPHASAYGDPVVRTPTFDSLARAGALFARAHVSSPSCTPSRAALLTGRHAVALGSGGNLYGPLDTSYPNYVAQLARAGYHTGMGRKGWGPGDPLEGGYAHNPAGPRYDDFAAFLAARPGGAPWCYWFGSHDPHRRYDVGSGEAAGLDPEAVTVPPVWPDLPEVRGDVLDYYAEVERFDRECGELLREVARRGEAPRTIVVMTSDNGMPFPRGKATLYDLGTAVPLVVSGPGVTPGTVDSSFVSLVDVAPTLLAAAGEPVPAATQGRTLAPLLAGQPGARPDDREVGFTARERHANVRLGAESYPMRAVRTAGFLYVRNFFPARWPAGDPEVINPGIGPYGDVDDGPTKRALLVDYDTPAGARRYNSSFGRRPAEELYDLARDPDQILNVAADVRYLQTLRILRQELNTRMHRYGDPRAEEPRTEAFDRYPYTLPKAWWPALGRE